MIEAVKAQQEQIEALRVQVDELQSMVDTMLARPGVAR